MDSKILCGSGLIDPSRSRPLSLYPPRGSANPTEGRTSESHARLNHAGLGLSLPIHHSDQSQPLRFDPDRALWKPGRRTFFFGLGAALLAPMLPDMPKSAIFKPEGLSMRFMRQYHLVASNDLTRLDILMTLPIPEHLLMRVDSEVYRVQ